MYKLAEVSMFSSLVLHVSKEGMCGYCRRQLTIKIRQVRLLLDSCCYFFLHVEQPSGAVVFIFNLSLFRYATFQLSSLIETLSTLVISSLICLEINCVYCYVDHQFIYVFSE